MIKRLLVAACLFFTFISFAQEGTASPYSFYGLGDLRFKGTTENRSMGGLSIFADSIHMNLQNPAFYSSLKLTNLALGATYATTRLKTNADEEKSRRTTLDYLAVGIPMGKFGAGFGLMPYTSVGYKLRTGTDSTEVRNYTGTGGLNKAFLGLSYQFNKNFSAGAEFGYYFGDIETNAVYDLSGIGVQYGTREMNVSAGSGAGVTLGLAYNAKVGKKLLFSSGATYSPEGTIRFSNERNLATVQFLSSGGLNVIDQQDLNIDDTEVKLPAKYSLGAGLGEPKKWMVGTEITFRQTSSLSNRFAIIDDTDFENAIKYNIGGYYIPDYNSFTSYAKKIVYRGGLRYETTGLVINGKTITDTGLTLGVGLPLGGTFSNINIGFEYGKRGTRDAALIEENYMNFSIGLSFSDKWFIKRKYD